MPYAVSVLDSSPYRSPQAARVKHEWTSAHLRAGRSKRIDTSPPRSLTAAALRRADTLASDALEGPDSEASNAYVERRQRRRAPMLRSVLNLGSPTRCLYSVRTWPGFSGGHQRGQFLEEAQGIVYGLVLFALYPQSFGVRGERLERDRRFQAGLPSGDESEFEHCCSNLQNSLRQFASGLAWLRN